MKKATFAVFALLASVLAPAVHADTVVLDQQPDNRQYLGETKYVLNPELGRAWVNVTTMVYHEPSAYAPYPGDHVPSAADVKVPGLSYDVANGAIVFAAAKGLVTCATVTTKHGHFGDKLIITPTGKCSVQARTTTVDVDNGFTVVHQRVVQTLFVTQE